MKKCLRQKCQKEFEPNKPKQVFCSAKCRVYFSREEKKDFEVKKSPITVSVIKEVVKETIAVKSKKEMPIGLDRIAQMRWMRENS